MSKRKITTESGTIIVHKNVPPRSNGVVAPMSLDDLRPHPDNPRTVRVDTESFRDLVASISRNGVLEPLTVRDLGAVREVLSGHRRLAAAREAGLTHVPVRDLGEIDDALAFDIVAMANLHEDLTPLEEGRRASLWLDKYDQDAQAVAAKLGRTARWVVEHAHIHRHLSDAWKKYAVTNPAFDRWSSAHWAVIARLPLALQARQLAKFGNQYVSYDRWSVAELTDSVKIDLLYLSQAGFDTSECDLCVDRSDAVHLLWGEPEEVTGPKTRCLNPQCYREKQDSAAKRQFRAAKIAQGVPQARPISVVPRPERWQQERAYNEAMGDLRRVHKGLLAADQFTLTSEGKKGAIPAIVVHGPKTQIGKLRWIQLPKPRKAAPSATQVAADQAMVRKREAFALGYRQLLDGPTPDLEIVVFLLMLNGYDVAVDHFVGQPPRNQKDFYAWIKTAAWDLLRSTVKRDINYYPEEDRRVLEVVAPLVGIDVAAIERDLARRT